MTQISVAVLGLGSMGGGMAGRLLEAGFPLSVYNRSQAAAEAYAARGARVASTPAEAVDPGGIVITMLANDAAVEAVTEGPDGVLSTLGPDGVHLCMSTISPALSASLAARHAEAGSQYLGAPVFGRPDAAASGKLWIALAGAASAKTRVQPVLKCLSQGIYDLGETPQAAHVAKIAGNFLIANAIEALAESFALVTKNGGDAPAFHKLISETLFACPIYQNYGRFVLAQNFSPPGFRLELGAKDIGLVLENGRQTQTPVPIASLLQNRFLAAMAKGRGGLDWTAIAVDVAGDAGLG
jgi:3-hydroxyisobutyrate dehydrogenase-like beta-hydroxyacid dehydrogenase